MKHVFVSYKSEDRERVRPLVEALRRIGVATWWDQDIPPGAPWEEAILQALHEADCVLVCWTSRSVHPKTGAKVQVEAREALDNEKLVQVRLDGSDPPLFFRQFQAANLSNWNQSSQDAEFQSVAQAALDILAGKAPARFKHVGRRRRRSQALVTAAAVLVLAASAPTLYSLARSAVDTSQAAHFARNRQDIRVLRVGSPFTQEKPRASQPDLGGVFEDDQSPALTILSTPAAGLLEAATSSLSNGLEPELLAFDNFGIFEPMEGVPYSSTTITEAFPDGEFLQIVGPLASRIQASGWVYLNLKAKNAPRVLELAARQKTCAGTGVTLSSARTQEIAAAIAGTVPGQSRVDLCSFIDHGEMVFASADLIVQTGAQAGLLSYMALVLMRDGTPEIITVSDDAPSVCLVGGISSEADCARMRTSLPQEIAIPESLSHEAAGDIVIPVVELTSESDMVNYRGQGTDIRWADFTWQTQAPEAIAYQLAVFDMGAVERVFAVKPAETGSISSGNLMGGGEGQPRWRVISVLHSGKVMLTDWKAYTRIDQYPDGQREIIR